MQRIPAKMLVALIILALLISAGAATRLQNIEAITPQAGDHLRVEANVSVAGNLSFQNQQTDMDLNSNRLEGLAAADSGDDAMRRDNIISQFVDASGDSMSGTLDMGGNNLPNLGLLTFSGLRNTDTGSADGFRLFRNDTLGCGNDCVVFEKTDTNQNPPDSGITFVNTGSDGVADRAFTINGNGNVDVHSGSLDMNGNSIVNFFGAGCGSGQAVQDISDAGGFTCASFGDAGVDYGALMNRSGGSANSMTGTLDMGSNNIQNLDVVQDSFNVSGRVIPSSAFRFQGGHARVVEVGHFSGWGDTVLLETGWDSNPGDWVRFSNVGGSTGGQEIRIEQNRGILLRNGQVGIGTDYPNASLDVQSGQLVVRKSGTGDNFNSGRIAGFRGSDGGGNGWVEVWSDDGQQAGLLMGNPTDGWQGRVHWDDGASELALYGGRTKGLTIDSGGNVQASQGLVVPVGADAWG